MCGYTRCFVGVGNVVLQVAAAANCTCYGIEKNEIPARYAKVTQIFLEFSNIIF